MVVVAGINDSGVQEIALAISEDDRQAGLSRYSSSLFIATSGLIRLSAISCLLKAISEKKNHSPEIYPFFCLDNGVHLTESPHEIESL